MIHLVIRSWSSIEKELTRFEQELNKLNISIVERQENSEAALIELYIDCRLYTKINRVSLLAYSLFQEAVVSLKAYQTETKAA